MVCVGQKGVWCGACGLLLILLSLFFFLFVLVFGVVRAQPCEHARNPRTPLRLSCYVLFSLLSRPFFMPRLSCYCGMAVCDSPCVGVLRWHDGYG